MARIGLVLHEAEPQALNEAERISASLGEQGHEVVSVADDVPAGSAITQVDPANFADGLNLAISLGGDGTMLRTVGMLCGSDVHILGVNFGDLGYLTVIEPGELDTAVERALKGDYTVEERMLVSGKVGGQEFHALNDLVVERAPGNTTVRIGVTIDDKPFTAYPADGLILATPTGSTAYSLSARGPIVYPTHTAMLLTPVSPHMLFDRSLVLRPDSVVELTIEGHRDGIVSVDGNTMHTMSPGDTMVCTASNHVARLVTFDRRDNLGVLKVKLGIADR